MRISSRTKIGTVIAAAWLGLVAAGFSFAYRYEATPGKGTKSSDWPKATGLKAIVGRSTIVHFVLPECPCSKVGLLQLGDAFRRQTSTARLIVVVCGTMGKDTGLEQAPNVRIARAIPGAEIVFDPEGVESRRFDAHTSGQTTVFSPNGKQVFSGGVTDARGHYGANAGLGAVRDVLQNRDPSTSRSPVYGCSFSSNP